MTAAARKVEKTDNILPLVTVDQLTVDHWHLIQEVAELENECVDLPPVAEDAEDLELITASAGRIIKLSKRVEETRSDLNRPYIDASATLNDFFKHGLNASLTARKTALEKVSTAFQRKKAQREQAERDRIAAEAAAKVVAAEKTVTETVKAGDVHAATVAVTETKSLAAFAAKASAAAAAPTSQLGQVRTDAGTVALVDNWTFADLDMNAIDLEALRPHLSQGAIEAALRGYIKSGRREIKGATIFNDNRSRFHT